MAGKQVCSRTSNGARPRNWHSDWSWICCRRYDGSCHQQSRPGIRRSGGPDQIVRNSVRMQSEMPQVFDFSKESEPAAARATVAPLLRQASLLTRTHAAARSAAGRRPGPDGRSPDRPGRRSTDRRTAEPAGPDVAGHDPNRPDPTGRDVAGPDLAGRDLVGRDLTRRDLAGADLSTAWLIGADLRGADLRWADLLAADLRGANLGGADLTGALYLTRTQVRQRPRLVHHPPAGPAAAPGALAAGRIDSS